MVLKIVMWVFISMGFLYRMYKKWRYIHKRRMWLKVIKLTSDEEIKKIFRILMEDNLDPVKWYSNWLYINSFLPLEMYKKFLGTEILSPTPSCPKDFLDIPPIFPKWFVAAYPEVVNTFADLAKWSDNTGNMDLFYKYLYRIWKGEKYPLNFEEEIQKIKEELPEDWECEIIDQDGKFTKEFLIKLKNSYKWVHPGIKFECE